MLWYMPPILRDSIRRTEEENTAVQGKADCCHTDDETSGLEEFVVVDLISDGRKICFRYGWKEKFSGKAMRQCLLAVKDRRENNGDGKVYGFVTTGELLQMIEYDGKSCQMAYSRNVVFGIMDSKKEGGCRVDGLCIE